MSDITPLIPWLNEPFREQEVLEAARKLQPPFLLREVVQATGLPNYIVHLRLTRLVKKGILTRCKAMMAYDNGLLGGGRHTWPRGTVMRAQYLYSWAEPE